MKATLHRFAVLLAFGLLCFSASAAQRAQHVFIISIDGGKPAVIQQSEMPVLKKLAAEGAHTWTANTIFPSITLPSHTSMVTGVGPDKHKVLWNDWIPSNGVVKVTTIFAEAKKAGFSTAMFVGKEKFRHLELTNSLDKFEYNRAASGEMATNAAGQMVMGRNGTVLAAIVAKDAAAYIKDKKPALCFIHLTDPDNAGHSFGWGSPEQIKAFGEVDAALDVVLKAIRDAGIMDESVLIISADHGGHAKTHGSRSADDMNIPWIAWGKGVKHGLEIKEPVKTFDTAATALWLLDVPRPASFDGKPVISAFE